MVRVAPSSEDRHAFRPGKGLPPRLIADHLNGLRHQATSIEWGNLMMPAGVDTPRNQRCCSSPTRPAARSTRRSNGTTTATRSAATSRRCSRSFGDRQAGHYRRTDSRCARGLTLATRGLRSSAGGRQREGSGPSAASPRCHCFQRLTGSPNPPSLSPTPRGMQRVRPIVTPQSRCALRRNRLLSVRR